METTDPKGASGQSMAPITAMGKALTVCIAVNAVYVCAEIFMGFRERSFGLLSDAGYNLGDIFSMALAFVYVRQLAAESPEELRAHKRKTRLLVVANTMVVLIAVGAILAGACLQFLRMSGWGGFAEKGEINGLNIGLTAAVGILVNGLTAWALARRKKPHWNVENAFRILSLDTLISIVVAIAGLAIHFRHSLAIVDPLLGIVVAVLMAVAVGRLLRRQLIDS